jgi:hypothetical protein
MNDLQVKYTYTGHNEEISDLDSNPCKFNSPYVDCAREISVLLFYDSPFEKQSRTDRETDDWTNYRRNELNFFWTTEECKGKQMYRHPVMERVTFHQTIIKIPLWEAKYFHVKTHDLSQFIQYTSTDIADWPPLWSSGQSSWLQIRRPGFDYRQN